MDAGSRGPFYDGVNVTIILPIGVDDDQDCSVR